MTKRRAEDAWSSTWTAAASATAAPAASGEVVASHGSLELGMFVGRYRVIELLGQGSMGRVYRARDTELARDVALKWIAPGRLGLAQAQARLRREAQAMAKVEHPAVVRIYDVGISVGQLFVAMELAHGGTVAGWLKARRRGWREVVRVFIEAGRGLAAAHRAGLVHRDVKPRNILLDTHGRAKVSDFGLARTFDHEDGDDTAGPSASDDVKVTQTGAIVGTPAYMASEQLAGGPIDARADQFAFCVALWEALCGRRPFRIAGDARQSAEALLQAIHRGSIDGPLAAVRVPRRVLALVRRGLAADRTQRWGSMDELLDALQRAARSDRAWWLAAVAGAGIAALALASTGRFAPDPAVVCGKRDEIASVWNPIVRVGYVSRAESLETALEDAGWFDWYARALDAEYATSCGRPDATRVACLDAAVEDLRTAIARSERDLWPRLRAIDRCGTALREIDIGSLSYGENARLSPDLRQVLVFGSGVASIRQLDGSASRSFDLQGFPMRWRSDGSLITSVGSGRIEILDEAGRRTTRSTGSDGRLMAVSSDLRLMAVDSRGSVTIQPLGGGDPVRDPIASNEGMLSPAAFSPDDRRFAMIALDPRSSNTLYIDDLVSRRRVALRFRLHVYGTGIRGVSWLDPNAVLIGGSALAGVEGDVWRVRVDTTGRLTGPPQVVLHGVRDAASEVRDVRSGRLLVQRSAMATQNLLLDGDSSSLLPGSGSRLMPRSADRARHRVLAATNPLGTRWAWMSQDDARVQPITSRVEPLSGLDGVRDPVVSPTGIAALDLRGAPPVYVAYDEAGVVRARIPIEAARGARPRLRCGDASCLVMWTAGAVAYTSRIVGDTIEAPVRHDQPDVVGILDWELSRDGERVAGISPAFDALILYDLAGSVTRIAKRTEYRELQRVRFLPDGALLVSAASGREFFLLRRDATGHERVLWRGPSYLAAIVPLDEHRTLVSTISWQYRISLFEPQ
jgi:hypothetical protein